MTQLRSQIVEAEIFAVESDTQRFAAATPALRDGACVAFTGIVRDHDHGRSVEELEYVAHPTAVEVLHRTAEAIAAAHPQVSSVRVTHRIGLLQIGECALYAQVCSPHRAEAFAACGELVEDVKRLLPVWKRQVFADGSDEWVNCP